MEEAKSDCEQSLFELKMALDEQAADAEAATMFGNWKRRGIWDYVFDLYPFADWPFDRRTGERRSATAVSQEEGGKKAQPMKKVIFAKGLSVQKTVVSVAGAWDGMRAMPAVTCMQ